MIDMHIGDNNIEYSIHHIIINMTGLIINS